MREMKPGQEDSREIKDELQLPEEEKPGFWGDSLADSGETDTDEKAEAAYYEARRQERHERILLRRKRRKRNRILGSVLAILVLVTCGGILFRKDIGKQFVRIRTAVINGSKKTGNKNSTDNKKDIDVAAVTGTTLTPEVTEEAIPTPEVTEEATPTPEVTEEATPTPEVTEEATPAPEVTEEATPTPEATEEVTPTPDPAAAAEAERIQQVLAQAENSAVQYDYDQAISLLQNDAAYGSSPDMQQAAAGYQQTKDACVAWSPEQVTHIFYHSLIVDPSKAFDGDYKQGGYDQVMTTMSEFNQITQTMYDKGYVMVSIYDLAQMDENGVMQGKEVHLPEGKIPFVLSQDDVCYYHSQDGDGIATKLVVDGDGRVRNEYVEDDGSISVGDYDVVPLIDRFVEAHPDFSYHGAKGIVALTGYNGILGYRTDISYQTRPDDLNDDKKAWLDAHPDFNLDTERAGAKAVADAMKAEGWIFASHTWGHKNMSSVSMERLVTDTQNFKENVDPLIGGTDIIIFAFGADINDGGDYTGDEKFEYLKSQGYNYYCNVDSSRYFVQIRDGYFRMGRRNVDGYRMYYNPDMLSDLFDASAVFDPSRPTPVPPMG